MGGVDVGKGDGEVDEEEVKVVKTPELELELCELLDMLLGVEGVPDLGGDDCARMRRVDCLQQSTRTYRGPHA